MAQSAAPMRREQGTSWMLPAAANAKSKLLYLSEYSSNEVDVYDYPRGRHMGTLTGFSSPEGECVDAKGDVYIANSGSGIVDEYDHGGKKLIKTYTTSGDAFGCSVDKAGDVAVTDFLTVSYGPGSVTVFAKGSSTGTVYSDPTNCHYIWPAGYDAKGNLVMVAENASEAVTYCAVLKGSKSLTLLTPSGFTIYSPASTMWDGKYIALGDQQAGGGLQSGIVEVSLSGSVLTSHGESVLSDTCQGGYTHVVAPFIVGHKNTPVNDRQAKVVVGANDVCSGDLRFWHYPGGGAPFKSFTFPASGESVSIAP
ncbi:MAG: hypothetical protein JOZ77_08740 [Candidatus Eremiobacteraeota bacterium]|nr:hypothetical protein [Candidatus Eremiobacteraeota bacterium]